MYSWWFTYNGVWPYTMATLSESVISGPPISFISREPSFRSKASSVSKYMCMRRRVLSLIVEAVPGMMTEIIPSEIIFRQLLSTNSPLQQEENHNTVLLPCYLTFFVFSHVMMYWWLNQAEFSMIGTAQSVTDECKLKSVGYNLKNGNTAYNMASFL